MSFRTATCMQSARPVRGRGGWCAAVGIGWLILFSAPMLAQEPPTPADAQADTEATSRRVDESEENFRARMELREQRFRERQRSNTTFSYTTGREGKLANLPPESQEHIRSQLADLVIESRLWKPGEDLSGYPYEPSPAAQADALLARQEREAWSEQLQNYQEREAARSAGPSSMGQQTGVESADRAESAPGPGGANQESAAVAGVTESALDFLRRRATADGAVSPSGDLEGASSLDAGAQRPMDGTASQQGDMDEAGDRDEPGDRDESGDSGEPTEAPPPGTLNIADLKRIGPAAAPVGGPEGAETVESPGVSESSEASERSEASESADASSNRARNEIEFRDVARPGPEPGTLDIQALRSLDIRTLRAHEGDEE